MTLAIDLTPLLPGGANGGAKLFAVDLVRHLAALRPAARLLLLTQDASHAELAPLEQANVRRHRVLSGAAAAARSRGFGLATSLLARLPAPLRRAAAHGGYALNAALKRRAGRALRGERFDLLFCPFTAPTFRAAGIPTVCTVYDQLHREYPQFFTPEERVLRERALADACRHATRLAAISEFTRAALEPEAPGRIGVIPLQSRLDAPGAAALPAGLVAGRYFAYLANPWPHKNHEMLLAAFAIARRRGLPQDLKLFLTGDPGPRFAQLERDARAMGLGECVVFGGFLERGALAGVLAGAAALVFPSLYEGFGLPVVEAMGVGTPVACSNRAALPEVAGDAALLFDPRVPEEIATAMLRLAAEPALALQLRQAGRARARRYDDPSRMAAAYWALFDGVLRRA